MSEEDPQTLPTIIFVTEKDLDHWYHEERQGTSGTKRKAAGANHQEPAGGGDPKRRKCLSDQAPAQISDEEDDSLPGESNKNFLKNLLSKKRRVHFSEERDVIHEYFLSHEERQMKQHIYEEIRSIFEATNNFRLDL